MSQGKKSRRGGEGNDGEDIYRNWDNLNAQADVIAATVSKKTVQGDPNRPMTQSNYAMTGERPKTSLTSNKGAGFNSKQAADPNAPVKSTLVAEDLDSKEDEDHPLYVSKNREAKVHRTLEQSATLCCEGKLEKALERAKHAQQLESAVRKYKKQHKMEDQVSSELTYAVKYNLGLVYARNKMYQLAEKTFARMEEDENCIHPGRLRVAMGNVAYEQKNYLKALKMYRIGLDSVPPASRTMRARITRNTGNTFVKMRNFPEAITQYEKVLNNNIPDHQTAFNLIICYYAVGQADMMKQVFYRLINIPDDCLDDVEDDEDDEDLFEEEDKKNGKIHQKKPIDALKKARAEQKKKLFRYVLFAAKLIAPHIESTFSEGFDWVIDALNQPRQQPRNALGLRSAQHNDTPPFQSLALEMEIAKGVFYLKRKNIDEAIGVFESFERKDIGLADQAATNLSFLFFLKNDLEQAKKYADIAVKADRYNAKALVNKANCMFKSQQMDAAKELYLEAISREVDCVEAVYNLGLVNKRMGLLEEALASFKKLHRLLPKDTQVVYQIGVIYDLLGRPKQAAEWLRILHGAVPNDPKVLSKLGALYNKQQDDTQAFHNFTDSYNVYPLDMEVISWLGVWYVQSNLYEEAIVFFERAAEIQPQETKWQLMVASCHRRMGANTEALNLYKKILRSDPDNLECLRYLVSMTSGMQSAEYDGYRKQLAKLERMQNKGDSRYNADALNDDASSGMAMPNNNRNQGGMAPERHTGPALDDPYADHVSNGNHSARQIGHDAAAPAQNRAVKKKQNEDDDDMFGDLDLGDDFLPS